MYQSFQCDIKLNRPPDFLIEFYGNFTKKEKKTLVNQALDPYKLDSGTWNSLQERISERWQSMTPDEEQELDQVYSDQYKGCGY